MQKQQLQTIVSLAKLKQMFLSFLQLKWSFKHDAGESPEFRVFLIEVSALPGGPVPHLQHLHDYLIALPSTLP